MDDEYQLRKDVDGIYRKFYDYQREKWDVVIWSELNESLKEIDDRLTAIERRLDDLEDDTE